MHIQYYLSNGFEIDFHTQFDYPMLDEVDQIAQQYMKACPNVLPTSIFVSVRIYKQFTSNFASLSTFAPVNTGPTRLVVNTSAGPLEIIPMPMSFDAKLFILGTRADAERYDLDKVFEATVLKDCERDT